MFLGPITAALISNWMLCNRIDITHLLLGQNNLGDLGFEKLTTAIGTSKTLICVDLQQNGLTPKSTTNIRSIMQS